MPPSPLPHLFWLADAMKLVNRWPLALMLALASMILKRMPELAFKTLSFALAVIVATYAMGRIVGIMQLKPQSLVARPRTSYFVALGFASAVVYFWFDKGREHRNLAWAIAICLFVAAVVLPFRYYAPTPENIGVPTPIYPEEIAQWLMERERRHAPFLDGDSGTVESHIVWAAGLEHARADVVVLSVHGWSATPRECEPVPTALATALGAHLYKHRLVGHGLAPDKPRGSEALLREATRNALLRDVVVAWKIARTLGRRVVVFGCSTGATLLSWLIAQPWMQDDEFARVSAAIFVSPAYALASPAYPVVKWTWRLLPPQFVSSLLHAAMGSSTYEWHEPEGPLQYERNEFWTSSYPTSALINIISLYWQVEHSVDFRNISAPLLVFANPGDLTVSYDAMLTSLRKRSVPNAPCIEWVDMSHATGNHSVLGDIWNSDAHNDTAISIALSFVTRWLDGGGYDGDAVRAQFKRAPFRV